MSNYKIKPENVLVELRRELAMRQRLYPGWVANGKIAAATAQFRIEAMETAIVMLEGNKPKQQKLLDL